MNQSPGSWVSCITVVAWSADPPDLDGPCLYILFVLSVLLSGAAEARVWLVVVLELESRFVHCPNCHFDVQARLVFCFSLGAWALERRPA